MCRILNYKILNYGFYVWNDLPEVTKLVDERSVIFINIKMAEVIFIAMGCLICIPNMKYSVEKFSVEKMLLSDWPI